MRFVPPTFIVIHVFYCVLGISESTDQGASCESDLGKTGSCLHINKCPEAIKLIHNKGRPKICGFEGKYPIVCCENKSSVLISKEHGLISKKKCSEYRVITTTTTTTTTTTLSPPDQSDSDSGFHIEAIGGVDAAPLEFPHMAILGYGSFADVKWSCGGSLISENFVLTAAHCINTRLGEVQYVKLGVHELNLTSDYEQAFKVKKFFKHPNYVRSQDYHDIALLELDYSVNIQSGVKPACLHTVKELPNDSLVATGWGAVELHGGIYNTLQKVDLSYVSIDNCKSYYDGQKRLNNSIVDDWQLCADGGDRRADTCQGDSGGPLQTRSDDKSLYTIVGITSTGLKCAVVPGIYTRVSHYVPWIERIVWPNK